MVTSARFRALEYNERAMAYLFCCDLHKGTEWKVEPAGDSFTVGCSTKARVPLPDRSLEGQEFVLHERDGQFYLRSLVERCQTSRNGETLQLAKDGEVPLETNDWLRAGSIVIVLAQDETSERETLARLRQAYGHETRNALAQVGSAPPLSARPVTSRRSLPWLAAAIVLGLLAGVVAQLAIARWRSGAAVGSGTGSPARANSSDDAPIDAVSTHPSGSDLDVLLADLAALEFGDDSPSAARRAEDAVSEPEGPPIETLRLFRLCEDLLGRPPLPQEVESWRGRPHAEVFDILFEAGPRRQSREVDAVIRHFHGGQAEEVLVVALEKRLADASAEEVWRLVGRRLTATPEYGSVAFRRPRSAAATARRLLADIFRQSTPAPQDVEELAAALEEAPFRAFRTVVYSPRAKLDRVSLERWQDWFFRLLRREPTAVQAGEIQKTLKTLPPKEGVRWLTLALLSHPDGGTY